MSDKGQHQHESYRMVNTPDEADRWLKTVMDHGDELVPRGAVVQLANALNTTVYMVAQRVYDLSEGKVIGSINRDNSLRLRYQTNPASAHE